MEAYMRVYSWQKFYMEIENVTLLSKEEYKENKNLIPLINEWWWLRSPGSYQDNAVIVFPDGPLFDYNVNKDCVVVRPALKIKNHKSYVFLPGDTIRVADTMWTILRDGLAICDEYIGRMCFRKDFQAIDANDYEKSDVKKFVDKWAKENLKG